MYKPPVLVIAAVQLLLVSLVSAALHFCGKPVIALSAFIGGVLCALPNAYFGFRVFHGERRHSGARAAGQVVESFYRAETGKFVLTLVGFAAVFAAVRPLNAAAVFISYGLCLLVQWLLAARLVK
ncbi:ATP synthase subunit I [Microbulbifer sp.]|uniref:ATP synthase subunit I n=1 Tax=Microbulbifer sp. TaxID=1908541 RepID=UPI003F2F84FE